MQIKVRTHDDGSATFTFYRYDRKLQQHLPVHSTTVENEPTADYIFNELNLRSISVEIENETLRQRFGDYR